MEELDYFKFAQRVQSSFEDKRTLAQRALELVIDGGRDEGYIDDTNDLYFAVERFVESRGNDNS